MTRALPVVAVLLAAVTLAVIPAAAHLNHASVDPQVSANGTVIVETAYVSTDGWVVIHRDEGRTPGEAIGHTHINAGRLQTDLTVSVNQSAWATWSNQTVWVALHRDKGDRSFDPAEDSVIQSFGRPSGDQFTLARGQPAVVTGSGFAPQRSGGNVTVRRATLPSDGHLVLHNGSVSGEAVGHVSLLSGSYRNISVPLNESFYRSNDRAVLVAALYTDDGDGTFDEQDTLVRANNASVATEFSVYLRNQTATPTGRLVTTATPGEASRAPSSDTQAEDSPIGVNGPGFDIVVTVTALVIALFAGALRRWDRV